MKEIEQQVSDIMLLASQLSEQLAVSEKETKEAIKITDLAVSTMTLGEVQMQELKGSIDTLISCFGDLSGLTRESEDPALMERTGDALTKSASIIEEALVNMQDVLLSTSEVTERLTRIEEELAGEQADMGQLNEDVSAVAGIIDTASCKFW